MPVFARYALPLVLAASFSLPIIMSQPQALAAPSHRVVLLSLDGAGERMMERMVEDGDMP
jgi:hypothetical protein